MDEATREIVAILNDGVTAPAEDMAGRRANFSAAWRKVTPAPPPGPLPETVMIARPDGTTLRSLLYRPARGARCGIVYFHGGGLMTLSPEDYDAQSRTLSNLLDAIVLVPDFRLIPEHVFPAAWEDAQAAYRWMLDHGGLPPSALVVMGDSAGGGLAASVSQEAARASLPQPAGQVLVYAMLDMAGAAPSRYDRGDWITDAGLCMIRDLYAGAAALDPRASPLRAPDLAGLAPAFILTTDLDPLLDEGRAYALRLKAAGVPVSYFCYESQTHGFLSFTQRLPEGHRALHHVASWIKATTMGGHA